jgi:hypothetical protein
MESRADQRTIMAMAWRSCDSDSIPYSSEVLYDRYMNQADDPEQSNGTEYVEVGKKLREALDSSRRLSTQLEEPSPLTSKGLKKPLCSVGTLSDDNNAYKRQHERYIL